ncbi:MAG: PQQ-binding-like beta-propeller repeat protein, partial [Planctomycetota bacterium]
MNRLLTWMLGLLFCVSANAADAPDIMAKNILEETGVSGGLIVHVGCGNGALTEALRAGDQYLVHGLHTDPSNLAKLRESLRQAGRYGPISVDTFDGRHLPYAENLVDLVVSENLANVSMDEVMRVLSPGGVAYVKADGTWNKSVKPVPAEIDDWTHYLHGSDNNAVARDTVVAPPRQMQWVAGPMFARSHEINSSMAAMVSGSGRLFYIWDKNPIGLPDKRFPADWQLIARDAFNGTVLWKRDVPQWDWRQWHSRSRWDDPRERAKMLRHLPASLPRRLVASDDRVYVTLGYRAPVSVMDAATGEILREFEDTDLTDEILCHEGMLVLRVRTSDSPPEPDVWGSIRGEARARVMAIDTQTGRRLWQTDEDAMAPLTLAACNGRAYYFDYQRMVCLDLKDGEELWRSQTIPGRTGHRGTVGTLVAQDKVVFFTSYPGGNQENAGRLHALSAETGELLWRGPKYTGPGITNPPDLFLADGLVWGGETNLPVTHRQIELKRRGFDPITGEVKREVVVPKLISWGHHYRCYRSKATDRFLLLPKRGVEFVDLVGEDHMRHDWLRAPCIYGMLPANGLLYAAPHQCVCYQGVLLSNFNALAPPGKAQSSPAVVPSTRLRKGPAWDKVDVGTLASSQDWPTYRRNPRRSGVAGTSVPDELSEKWNVQLDGQLTPPVVAHGHLLVAEEEGHTLRALDAESGESLWHFTAGGRIDSPPTVHGSLVLFGSTDGRVYCLRLSDGSEAWRFMAAPHHRRVTAFGQLESAWPVHGSVLVQKDVTADPPRFVAYFTAGRSSYLDGGIRVYGLDPRTGRLLHECRLDGPWPDPAEDQGGAGYMDGAKSDILTSDGADIYLFQERFRSDLKRFPAPMENLGKEGGGYRTYPAFPERGSTGERLITTHGYLADVDNEGKYWTYGNRWPGWDRKMSRVSAYGQLLAFDDEQLYGVHVFTENIRVRRGTRLGGKGPRLFARDQGTEKDRWSHHVPIHPRGLVLASDKLLLAGTPDIVPEDDPLAAIEGRRGAVLM